MGVVSTGDSLDRCATDDKLMAALPPGGASVKEMEAAAIAEVAGHFGTPFFAVKSITDIVDGGQATAEEFSANLTAASDALQVTMGKVLDHVGERALEDLK